MLTTIQDLGRWGRQGQGIPVAGPMDAYSHRYANALVGNDEAAAALEITLIGPVARSVAGCDMRCHGRPIRGVHRRPGCCRWTRRSRWKPARRIRFGARGAGARAALAVRGGFDVRQFVRQPGDQHRQPHGAVRRTRASRGRCVAGRERPSRSRGLNADLGLPLPEGRCPAARRRRTARRHVRRLGPRGTLSDPASS